MAHSHSHSHGGGQSTYLVDQLCSIAACGLVSIAAVMMYRNGMLKFLLVKDFWPWVLGGGILLAALVFFRMIGVWLTTSAVNEEVHDENCGHDHGHSHAAAHSHALPVVEEAHDHPDHGWAPWRYAVLMLPVVLYFLNFPNSGFSNAFLGKGLKAEDLGEVRKSSGSSEWKDVDFNELSRAAIFPDSRATLEGRRATVEGQYSPIPGNDKSFQLFTLDTKCCAGDTTILKARVISSEPIQAQLKMQDWVRVEGQIQFIQPPGKKEFLPVLFIDKDSQITLIPAP